MVLSAVKIAKKHCFFIKFTRFKSNNAKQTEFKVPLFFNENY